MPEEHIPMIGVSLPMVGEAGLTRDWRTQRPVIDPSCCLTRGAQPRDCMICWLYCPEPAIAQGKPPTIDYEYCKGCGICVRECPAKAITMVDEGQK
jgi:pyruvate ferredoxin oxidoreductase delta subunit